MKATCSRLWQSGLAMLLAICMVVGMCPAVAFAATQEDDVIRYVSFGASNTNGYGIRGYLPAEVSADPLIADKSTLNVYGYDRAPETAYPAQVAEALEASTGKTVELSQLAISSMRVEEVRMLLDEDYYGDAYTRWRFYNENGKGWFAQAESSNANSGEQALANLRETYKEAVINADVITMDMGMNNFGVFTFNNIKNIMADGRYWKEPDFSMFLNTEMEAYYYAAKEMVLDYLADDSVNLSDELLTKLDMVADVLAYASVGFCYNFDQVMGIIYELNPDVDVVVVSIQNLLHGVVVDFEGLEIPIGSLYGELIDLTNIYTASVSPYAEKYVYAHAGENGHATTFLDEIIAWDGDPETLTLNMKDCFDMYDDGLYIRSIVEYLMVAPVLLNCELPEELQEMVAQGNLDLDAIMSNQEILAYVAEAAAVLATFRTGNNLKNELEEALYYAYRKTLNTAYGILAEVVQEAAKVNHISVGTDTLNGYGKTADTLVSYMLSEALTGAQTTFMNVISGNADYTYEFEIKEDLLDDPAVAAVAALSVRFDLGNSFYAHPNDTGHDELTEAIVNALENNISGDAFTKSKIVQYAHVIAKYLNVDLSDEELYNKETGFSPEAKQLLRAMVEIVAQYGAEYGQEIWAKWVDAGYIDAAYEDLAELLKYYTGYTIASLEDMIEAVNGMAEDRLSMTADLTVDNEFKYVAIGDGSAAANGYAELLAASINAGATENSVKQIEFVNNAYMGNTVANERENLSDVADADLVTIGFANVEFLDQAINYAMDKNAEELDWIGAVGEENVQYVDQLLAKVAEEIAAMGIDETFANLIYDVIEAYAFHTVLYAVELPGLISDIKEISPDAQIVIVGMYNPVEGVSISMNGSSMEISEYLDYLIDATKIHGVGYSILSGDAIYVEIPAIETKNEDTVWTMMDMVWLVFDSFADLYPSENGHETIWNAIDSALDITYVDNCVEHVFTKVVTDPTCTEQGYTTYTCACGYSYVDDYVDATGHTYDSVVTDPTCTERGYTTYTCACGDSYVADYTDMIAHTYGEWSQFKAPDENGDGEDRRYCACGHYESRAVENNPFEDILDDKYYTTPVLWAYYHGITSGATATTFGWSNTCTRAQVVTFLWKAAGSPEPETTENPFADVNPTSYYYNAVLWAVENGITSGTSATTFGPGKDCTRAQVMTFLWKAAGSPEPEMTESPFEDVKSGSYYYKAVLWAVENGITSGTSTNTFGSGNTCTRAHVMTFLYTTVVKNEIELNP